MDEEAASALRTTVTKSGRKVKRPLHLASPERSPPEAGHGSPAKSIGRKSRKASVSDDREKGASGTPIKQSVSSDDQTSMVKSSSRKTLTRKTLTAGNSEVKTPKKGNEVPNPDESGVSKSGRKIKVPTKLTDYESSLVGSPRKGGVATTTAEREAGKTPARTARSAKNLVMDSESSANKAVMERPSARKTNVSDSTAAKSIGDLHEQSTTTPTKTRGRRARSVAPIKPIPDESLSEEERLLKQTRTPGRRLLGISMIDIGSTIEPQQTKQRKRATAVMTKEIVNEEPVSKKSLVKESGKKKIVAASLVKDVLSKTSITDSKGEGNVITTELREAGAQESDIQKKEAQNDLTITERPTADVQLSNKKKPRGPRAPEIVVSEVSAARSPVSASPEGQGVSRSGRKIKPKKIFGSEDGGADKSIIVSITDLSETPVNSFVTRRNIDDHHHASNAKMVPSVVPIDEPDRAVPLVDATAVSDSIDVPPTSRRSGRVIKAKKFFDDASITEKKKSLAISPARRPKEKDSVATGKTTANQSPTVAGNSVVETPHTLVSGDIVNVNVPSLDGVDVAEGPLQDDGSSNVIVNDEQTTNKQESISSEILQDDTTTNKQDDAGNDLQKSRGESFNKSIPSENYQDRNEIQDVILATSQPLSPPVADPDPVEEHAKSGPVDANVVVLQTVDIVKPADDSESTHLDDAMPIEKQTPVATDGASETSIIVIPDTPAPVEQYGRQLSDTFSPEKPMLPNERIPHIIPEFIITEAPTPGTASRTVAAPRTPDTKTSQANECSPDKPPEVIEIFDSPASTVFCQQMKSGNSTSSTPLILLNAAENQPTLQRKRSMSTSAAEIKKRNVKFHSPANVTVLVDTIDEIMQKNVVRRKRSLSEHAPGAAVGTDDGVKPNKISKIPNFKNIHEKNFKRMESIGDFMKRKEKRAQMILTAASPATKLLAQGVSATTNAKPRAPTDAKHNQVTIEKTQERLFTFKSGGGGTSAAASSMINKVNPPTAGATLFQRRPIARGPAASSLRRPMASNEQRLANRQRLYKRAPVINATSSVVASSETIGASGPSTASLSSTTIPPVDQLRTKQSTILKGVRTNRRFELQMKHRDNLH
ncbi:mucin-17 [Anopheles darlingi]|uniref:mucin-17 n=1 Tax=Anopheles darlingi TaxID=43151 RepID=UPI00210026CB|nr:mucin-17 [Anopheles darlingi]